MTKDLYQLVLIMILFALVLFGSTARADAQSLSGIYKQVNHAVVALHTVEKQMSPKKPEGLVSAEGLGSGVLVSADGKVLTAAHVVHTADTVKVEFWNGQIIPARVIASAPEADVALLQLDKVPDDVSPVDLGDSDQVEIGEEVFVIGNPYGLGRTLTAGYVSARHRSRNDIDSRTSLEMLQTDAAINMGNSGGPMFDMDGRVVGIASRILSQSGGFEGLGFVVTSNLAKRLLLDEHSFWAGLTSLFLTDELVRVFNLPQTAGLLVQQVAEGSPAAKLGLHQGQALATVNDKNFLVGGDIILEMEGVQITSDRESAARIQVILNHLQAGSTFDAKVYRAGQIVALSTTL